MRITPLLAIIWYGLAFFVCSDVARSSQLESAPNGNSKSDIRIARTDNTQDQEEWRNSSQIHSFNVLGQDELILVTERTNQIFRIQGNQSEADFLRPNGIVFVDSIDVINGSMGWLVDMNGDVWKTNDACRTWQKTASLKKSKADPDFIRAPQIKFASPERGWLRETFKVFSSKDGGYSWHPIPDIHGQPAYMFFVGEFDVWVVSETSKGNRDYFYLNRTKDGGETWITKLLPMNAEPSSLFFVDSLNGWIVDGLGQLFTTKDGGNSWSKGRRLRSGFIPRSIFWVTSRKGWLVGYTRKDANSFPKDGKGAILKTENGGESWRKVMLKSDEPFFAQIRFENPSVGWVVGREGIYSTEDGGSNWNLRLRLQK